MAKQTMTNSIYRSPTDKQQALANTGTQHETQLPEQIATESQRHTHNAKHKQQAANQQQTTATITNLFAIRFDRIRRSQRAASRHEQQPRSQRGHTAQLLGERVGDGVVVVELRVIVPATQQHRLTAGRTRTKQKETATRSWKSKLWTDNKPRKSQTVRCLWPSDDTETSKATLGM